MARTCSPLLLRSPSPHTFLTTLSDPLHQRAPPGMHCRQSADHQHHPSSSTSSCHASLPLPSQARAVCSPGRRKLPAIPAAAANTKFPSVIRITRAQLQQVNSHFPLCFPLIHMPCHTRHTPNMSLQLQHFLHSVCFCIFGLSSESPWNTVLRLCLCMLKRMFFFCHSFVCFKVWNKANVFQFSEFVTNNLVAFLILCESKFDLSCKVSKSSIYIVSSLTLRCCMRFQKNPFVSACGFCEMCVVKYSENIL